MRHIAIYDMEEIIHFTVTKHFVSSLYVNFTSVNWEAVAGVSHTCSCCELMSNLVTLIICISQVVEILWHTCPQITVVQTVIKLLESKKSFSTGEKPETH